jgi:outer membrane protein TolC
LGFWIGEGFVIRGLSGIVVVGAFALVCAGAFAADATHSAPEADGTLEAYIALAMESSPGLGAALARQEAAAALIGRVGALPDPVVSYGHYFDEVETRVGPQVYRLGVRQRLPWFGKLSLAEDAARERAAAQTERVRAVRLDVVVSVTQAYADFAYLTEAIAITEERASLLRTLDEVVRAAYSSGSASYGDVMKSQIGLARVEDKLSSMRAGVAPASSRLAAAVGLRVDSELPVQEVMPSVEGDPVALDVAAFELQSPDLLALRHETEAARFEQRLARRGPLPDLTLGVDYIATDDALMPVEDSGKDPLVGVASISVPLWFGKHVAAARQAGAAVSASERATEQRALELVAELRALEFELDDALRKVALYEDRLVPAAEQAVSSTEASYRAGTADFDALVTAHESALEFELALARARADALIAKAKLARLTGATGHAADD